MSLGANVLFFILHKQCLAAIAFARRYAIVVAGYCCCTGLFDCIVVFMLYMYFCAGQHRVAVLVGLVEVCPSLRLVVYFIPFRNFVLVVC